MVEMEGNGQICWLFVLIYAAFTDEPGTLAERKLTGILIAEFAEVNASNTSACWQRRKQTLALKTFYRQLQQTQRDSRISPKTPELR